MLKRTLSLFLAFVMTNVSNRVYYVGECVEPNLAYSAPNAPRTDVTWVADEGITILYSYPGGARLRFDQSGTYTLTATDGNSVSANIRLDGNAAASVKVTLKLTLK